MDDNDTGGSTPCLAHMIVDGQVVDPEVARDVARFRKAERARLYALRSADSVEARVGLAQRLSDLLDAEVGDLAGQTVGVYWPIRGELDLRGWMGAAHARGARLALPVVVERAAPVEFHAWAPGDPMRRGDWNIPVPERVEVITPDLVVVPLVGVDAGRYRLGNGGGYYDRTLVRLPEGRRIIGVGQGFCRMETIFPMPWDVPMDRVILADGSVF